MPNLIHKMDTINNHMNVMTKNSNIHVDIHKQRCIRCSYESTVIWQNIS